MQEKIISATSTITLTTSGSLIIYGVTFQSIESFIGIAIASMSFIVMWYYKHKQTKILLKNTEDKEK